MDERRGTTDDVESLTSYPCLYPSGSTSPESGRYTGTTLTDLEVRLQGPPDTMDALGS